MTVSKGRIIFRLFIIFSGWAGPILHERIDRQPLKRIKFKNTLCLSCGAKDLILAKDCKETCRLGSWKMVKQFSGATAPVNQADVRKKKLILVDIAIIHFDVGTMPL